MSRRKKSPMAHNFNVVPVAKFPRSAFDRPSSLKSSCEAGILYPFFWDEVLPGDTHHLRSTIFARLNTPLYPIMDDMWVDTFFFFVPNRLVYDNWKKLMGERKPNPTSSIDFQVPIADVTKAPLSTTGYLEGSLQDYFGLPIKETAVEHTQLFPRAYNLIHNTYFKDQDLKNDAKVDTGDGPDDPADYVLLRTCKRNDYFTSCRPWPQKPDTTFPNGVTLPLGDSCPIIRDPLHPDIYLSSAGGAADDTRIRHVSGASSVEREGNAAATAIAQFGTYADGTKTGLKGDLSSATAAQINDIRLAFQLQKFLERDVRSGTRYEEGILAHWGVTVPDFRVQIPQFLGSGSTPVNIHPIAQTSATVAGQTPQGNLTAMGTFSAINHGFNQSFSEHGVIIGLFRIRANLTYQQCLQKMWSRRSRFDFFTPEFSGLGEMAVLSKEIFYSNADGHNEDVFGYQERDSDYRTRQSMLTGLMRSNATGSLDYMHLAQNFGVTRPVLNQSFIEENPPLARCVAVPSQPSFRIDVLHDLISVRVMPVRSVPGHVDHF